MLDDVRVLLALEPVEQHPPQGDIEILLHSRHDLFQEIHVRRAGEPLLLLLFEILVEDRVDRFLRGERHEGEVLGDFFPVVDEEGFDVVRDGDLDHWPVLERFFLFSRQSR